MPTPSPFPHLSMSLFLLVLGHNSAYAHAPGPSYSTIFFSSLVYLYLFPALSRSDSVISLLFLVWARFFFLSSQVTESKCEAKVYSFVGATGNARANFQQPYHTIDQERTGPLLAVLHDSVYPCCFSPAKTLERWCRHSGTKVGTVHQHDYHNFGTFGP